MTLHHIETGGSKSIIVILSETLYQEHIVYWCILYRVTSEPGSYVNTHDKSIEALYSLQFASCQCYYGFIPAKKKLNFHRVDGLCHPLCSVKGARLPQGPI